MGKDSMTPALHSYVSGTWTDPANDGTPVLDIKPVMKGFLPRGEIREPEWAREIMRTYW